MSEPAKTVLFLVPTPIGNLGDITLRGLEILKTVDTILAEDTRKSGLLLKHYDIKKSLQSFHIFNEHKVLQGLVKRMAGGEVMALVTDAGTPGISDPGFLLVRECLAAGLKIECLPGATAFVPALVKSGFPTDRFVFEGFLPHKKGRQTALKELTEETRTVVLYESPHRLIKTLEQMMAVFEPDRMVSVSRELTKIHEETFTGTLQKALHHFKEKEIKGEIVIVLNGKKPRTNGATPGRQFNAIVLLIAASIILSTGWLMKSFPVLIFVGLTPLFALTDKTQDSDRFWEYAELILISLGISFFAGHFFDFKFLIATISQSIALTLSFVGYAFCRQSLGPKVGKFTIALFWLGTEYIFLKINSVDHVLFLADAVRLKEGWLNWTYFTGYLGASAWILTCNLLLYNAFLRKEKINWVLTVLFVVTFAGPIVFSQITERDLVARLEMEQLYQNGSARELFYGSHGEFIPRTAAWISVLIFTFALVKSKTRKK